MGKGKENIELKSVEFQLIIKGFGSWLDTLGYVKSTVYGQPRQAIEFLEWLEKQEITTVKNIVKQHFYDFIEYFKQRPNKRTKGGLSSAHINKQINALNRLIEYLRMNRNINFSLQLKQVENQVIRKPVVLTKSDVQDLYKATDNTLIGIRDRAMLTVYYGCGLRKSEGLFLDIDDVLFDRKQLYVRKAKNGHQRYVPIPIKGLQDLENYIYSARPLLLDTESKNSRLFISEKGTSLHPESMKKRLDVLREKSNNTRLKDTTFGLHTLRHSIATHLLQAGIELENIALFLGHKSLDSTQVYTHLLHDLENE